MRANKVDTMKSLVDYLNACRDHYYNDNVSMISDEEYDSLVDDLEAMERDLGFHLSNSPTHSVGYTSVSELSKVRHDIDLLSLSKTQDVSDLINMSKISEIILMHKLDGLTCLLTYENGNLIRAETRGDGFIGEDITHNYKSIIGIPETIPVNDRVHIIGEVIINKNDFDLVNSRVTGKKYSTQRNLASGSVRTLDSKVCASRFVRFICWNANDLSTDGTMASGFDKAASYGFTVVHCVKFIGDEMKSTVENMKQVAVAKGIPIDGIVAMYNDIKYGESLGKTEHHPRCGIAYKFYEDMYETNIKDVSWSIGRTGVLTPVANFYPVEIDGTMVSNASLHNVTQFDLLNLYYGDTIVVYKSKEIIPQIKFNMSAYDHDPDATRIPVPNKCPYCGSDTFEKSDIDSDSIFLYCSNNHCSGILSNKIEYILSRNCLNINGFATKTIDKILETGYVKSVIDIFKNKKQWSESLSHMQGFSTRSVGKLVNAIDHNSVEFYRFICALCIPEIGSGTSKVLSEIIAYNIDNIKKIQKHELVSVSGIGESVANSVMNWISDSENIAYMNELRSYINIKKETNNQSSNVLENKSFVITGKLNKHSRSDLEKIITDNGGSVIGAVYSKTDYLISNEINSTSSKTQAAKKHGVKIITEDAFMQMLNSADIYGNSLSEEGRLF